ncbi:hypothetical protein SAMN02745194_01360 [Roseomonas rosea]|uniref:Lipoprotein n=1 Tax=Muricoccus roseus TaxID=198092 RepID=A0A1M6F1H0_9PROT|nr:hypothetical protein [Roseomonas rosea]SHI91501.1 hypothetical protein SAMN02745194_01360 [Roseomonas rosea]
MKVRLFPALALGAALATAGCQNPDGSTDWGSTLALGAGVGLAAGLVAAAASDNGPRYRQPPRRHQGSYGYGRPYAQGYGHGYGRGWR